MIPTFTLILRSEALHQSAGAVEKPPLARSQPPKLSLALCRATPHHTKGIYMKIIAFIVLYIFVRIVERYVVAITLTLKHCREKHHCNYCEFSYTETIGELNYKYCAYCGKPLDYYKEDERSQYYKGE